MTTFVPPARHLLRAKALADERYFEPLGVDELARAAGLLRATSAASSAPLLGESARTYVLTRRMERAAALLRSTDRSVADVCLSVGLQSIGSFTTSFKRTYGVVALGVTPTQVPLLLLYVAGIVERVGALGHLAPSRRSSRSALRPSP